MAEIGKLQKTEIVAEMKRAYLDYAMSVIVSRALPDVRDGLKPVHRRILFAMSEMGLGPTSKFLKSARIVGEVMGKYHPHGNMAIYDSLVRLAQDFSMRYPLINGQGNFGCFTKDTKVQLTDGRSISFEELVEEQGSGKRHWTFAFNQKAKRIEIAEIKHPRITKKDAKLIEVTLDNGEKIRCTPNHRFMLRTGEYREAQNLKSGDSLMPLYLESFKGEDNNLKNYKQVYQPTESLWQFVHHLSDEWNLEHKIYEKSSGRIRHHKDINKFNNNPDNIVRLDWEEHWHLHASLSAWRHKNDAEYVRKLAEGRKKYLEENKEKISQRTSALNKKLWKNKKYRAKHINLVKRMWENVEYREMMKKLASSRLKAMWLDPTFIKHMGNLKSQELKKRWQDPNYKKAMGLNMRSISMKLWENPAHKSKMSALMKDIASDPNWRKTKSEIAKSLWQDEAYRKKFTKDHFSKMAEILWSNPKTVKFHREKLAKQRQNPEFRQKLAAAVMGSYRKRLTDEPEIMTTLAKLSAKSLRKKWQDPEYKKRVIKSKTLRFASALLATYQQITPKMYEEKRINDGTPRLENALKYFDDFSEITTKASHYNHKVISVKSLNIREDVYDLTVDKWHNFALGAGIFVHNSMDGDPPAADRYTEAKLQAISMEMLLDIDKETVDFIANYDGSFKEPAFLPSLLPNLLLMGSEGIAVGMATKIPPHNLSEVIDGLSFLIDKVKITTEPSLHVSSEVTVDELLEYIKGPDFPTAGAIYDWNEIKNVYTTGRGRILIRGKAEIEDIGQGKSAIIITELPYQVNKALLVARIADLAKEKKVDGISDLRDESDRHGIRVVVELKRDATPKKVLNNLFKHTSLQTTFPANIVALVDGTPQTLNLKTILEEFLKHRYLVVKRRSEFELRQAKARLHILEGLKIAVENIDAVIKTIRESKTQEDAKENLMKKFKLSEIQAIAILDMQLRRLAALERQKIEEEYQMVKETITYLEDLLSHPAKILVVIKNELTKLQEKYKDERRTKVYKGKVGEFSEEDLIPNEPTVITITDTGYIKRQSTMSFRTQQRGGKGIIGMTTKDEDNIADIKFAQTHDNLLFFTNKGKVYQIKAYEISESSRTSKGTAIVNLLNIEAGEKAEAFVAYGKHDKSTYVLLATRNGTVKKSKISEFENIRKSGILAIKLEQGDELVWSKLTSANDQIFLFTRNGKCIKFSEDQIRPMGRNTMGVRGILIGKDDSVMQMDIVGKGHKAFALTIMQNGYGKKTSTDQFPKQGRGGQGVKVAEVTTKTGKIAYTQIIPASCKDVIITSQKGQIVKLDVNSVPDLSRATQGVILMRFSKQGDLVASATCIEE